MVTLTKVILTDEDRAIRQRVMRSKEQSFVYGTDDHGDYNVMVHRVVYSKYSNDRRMLHIPSASMGMSDSERLAAFYSIGPPPWRTYTSYKLTDDQLRRLAVIVTNAPGARYGFAAEALYAKGLIYEFQPDCASPRMVVSATQEGVEALAQARREGW